MSGSPTSGRDRRTEVLADLAAEGEGLDRLLSGLRRDRWRAATPAPGWDVAHQVAHLAWADEVAVSAATDLALPEGVVAAALEDPDGFVDRAAQAGAGAETSALLQRWRDGRHRLATVLEMMPEGERLPWFGPPMSATSMATARFMETWAHGLDIAEALGVAPVPTQRIRHVVHLGVRTRDYAFAVHGLAAPAEPFRVELEAPDGSTWSRGPEQAAQRVTGPAYDFCLLVTRRRHRADLALLAEGPDADRWLDLAQAFAGPPGSGREPTDRVGR